MLDFNDWYSPHKDPHLDLGDAELALNNFFHFCYSAGPEICALWAPSPAGIRSRFLEADGQILQKPLPVPGYGLLKAPLWRSGVYQSLYRPDIGFPLLAAVATEILNGIAGPGIQAYLKMTADSSAEPPLSNPETALKNGPSGSRVVFCSDSNTLSDAADQDLEAVVTEYLQASSFFAGMASQYPLICMGKFWPLPKAPSFETVQLTIARNRSKTNSQEAL